MSKLGPLHLTKHTGPKHTATVIFFHGSGSSGEDVKEWVRLMVKNFKFPHINIMYPTAPLQPYTPAGGQPSTVWFDRAEVASHVPEKLESIDKIEVEVRKLIRHENDAGIASNRIVVGGFSMGGALAMHTGFRWDRSVAGAFAFSSFLNFDSAVYDDLKKAKDIKAPPFLQIHGTNDEMVDLEQAQTTFQKLSELGVVGDFHIIERLGHSLDKRGLLHIKEFIEKLLPEV